MNQQQKKQPSIKKQPSQKNKEGEKHYDDGHSTHSTYDNPLVVRYSSKEMSYIFSPHCKFSTWRKLWIFLAEAQKDVGLPITNAQLKSMRAASHINFAMAKEFEKKLRHDVMAHVHTFAKAAPEAASIIHLGATSAFVGDNADLIVMKNAMRLVQTKLLAVMAALAKKAKETAQIPCLGYTHFQPAQPTTIGKRLCLYLQDFLLDAKELAEKIDGLPFRGVKGATGTQSSFLYLLGGDEKKLQTLQEMLLKKAGFNKLLTISGQTYTRKIDYSIASVLSGIAQSASKFSNDFRLMQHKGEWEEGMEKSQIGSSAMAYKRNPMKSERIGSLARFVMSQPFSLAYTASTQWFERTLDDSANKRLAIPQAFLAVDGILNLMLNIVQEMQIYPKVVLRNLNEEMPFIMSENIMMEVVKKGGNRQTLHEDIRIASFETVKNMRENGAENDLLAKLKAHSSFAVLTKNDWQRLANPLQYVGRSAALTKQFLQKEVAPVIKNASSVSAEIEV